MNRNVSSRYDEHIETLAFGLECVDSMRASRVWRPISVRVERAWQPRGGAFVELAAPQLTLERHLSCLHALRFRPGRVSHVALRIEDPERRYVPRRLLVPLSSVATLVNVTTEPPTIELSSTAPPERQWPRGGRRVHLLPGAAYDLPAGATVLRGRVTRDGKPVPWARIEARSPGNASVMARAHGDDRGEFVLVAGRATNGAELNLDERCTVSVYVPAGANPGGGGDPPVPSLSNDDPLAGLPIERVTETGPEDPVSAAERNTDAWGPVASSGPQPLRAGRTVSNTTIELA